jgi:acetyl-CoA acyltransferase
MNLGRSASLLAGLPITVPGYSVDRWCAGALTATTSIAGAIAIGSIDIAIAGGVEHMGNHPIGDGIDPNPRFLAERIVEQDALAMGATAERLHDRFPQLTKERADRYAYNSQMKTAAAYAAGKIQRDLIPTAARIPEMGWGIATVDEPPRPTTTMEGLATLKTPFRAAGRVTPGNSSGLNDGATAALLASEDKAKELGLTIKAKLVSYAFAGVEPEVMGYGPVPSTIKALAKAGLQISDIGAFEVNEAFAVQVIAFLDHFGIADDDSRVNPYGGAIAVGHPLASSGIRLMLNLARSFEEHTDVRYGLTTMCIGLGMGGTVIWENPHFTGGSKK